LSKIVRSLMRANNAVRSATSISEARSILQSQPPKVLCLDVQLPDGNGLAWLEELRNEGTEIPVVIISGHHSAEDRIRAEDLGAAGFLAKPFALSDLHRLLTDLLKTVSAADDTHPGQGGTPTNSGTQKEPATGRDKVMGRLAPGRLARAKRAYATRHASLADVSSLVTGGYSPKSGDLVLARVDKLSQHGRLELADGRRATLHAGDEILICYGNRYAPDQFEAEVPKDLSPCHLVAAGGIAAAVLSRSAKVRPATRISPIGVLAHVDGRPINLSDFALVKRPVPSKRPQVTAVLGTSMNAGKTTTLANLALGMKRQGLKVSSAKVTGTGAGCDLWQMIDAGCHRSVDFTDAGVPSTYRLPAASCERIMRNLVGHLCEEGIDHILIEVADGILQEETRELVTSATFAQLVDNVIFAAGDALGAANGVTWLQAQGLNVIGVSGMLTAAPLAMRECAALVYVPVLALEQLNGGKWPLCSDEKPSQTRVA
jgi:CheY-like chemotaxis protein